MIGAMVPDDVLAAEWRITPTLGIEETYTDNLRLAPRGREESDWVTEVSPGFSVSAEGARLRLRADYSFQYRFYAKNSDENGHNHSLSSNALWDVWNKELFLEGSAYVAQQNISPLGQVAASNANVTGNRTETRQATVSPYWVRNLGNWARLNARYTYTKSDSSGDFSVYDSQGNAVNLGVSSGPAFGYLGWGLNYSYTKTESSSNSFESRESENTVGNVRYQILPTFALTATLGYESQDYTDLRRGSTSGQSWSVGGDWAPSPRTRVSGSFGERYFGNTYKLDASHRTRLTTWTISYSEDVTDAPFIAGVPLTADTTAAVDRLFISRIPDPRERQIAVQTFITQNGLPLFLNSPVQFQTNQVTLVKRWQAGVGMQGTRGTLLLNVFREERENLSVGAVNGPFDPFALSNTIEQIGYSATMSWRLSERTSALASYSHSRNKYPDANGREDTDGYWRIGLTHQIQPRILGTVNLRLIDRNSDDPTAEYREKAIVGTLRVSF